MRCYKAEQSGANGCGDSSPIDELSVRRATRRNIASSPSFQPPLRKTQISEMCDGIASVNMNENLVVYYIKKKTQSSFVMCNMDAEIGGEREGEETNWGYGVKYMTPSGIVRVNFIGASL